MKIVFYSTIQFHEKLENKKYQIHGYTQVMNVSQREFGNSIFTSKIVTFKAYFKTNTFLIVNFKIKMAKDYNF